MVEKQQGANGEETAEGYRRRAAECRAQAAASLLPNESRKLEMAAQRWQKLADMEERIEQRTETAKTENDRALAAGRGTRRPMTR